MVYFCNPAFDARESYLCHKVSGDCVSVDRPLYEMWQLADGKSAEELWQALGRPDLGIAELESVLRFLVRADLLRSDDDSVPSVIKQVPANGPLVSVVVLNMNGRHHLHTCLDSLMRQTYRNLEVILVDNGSRDGSVDFVHENFPSVRVVALPENLGFAGGNNEGFRVARGEYIFVLNNDTEVAPDCVTEMVRVIERDAQIAAVAPLVKMYYLRGFVNGLGNVLGPIGWGADCYVGHVDIGQFREEEIFSACFGAVLLRRSALERVGLLDTGFGIGYYEDSDWCYRARMAGYKVFSAPRAVVYHKFSATMKAAPSAFKLTLVARNRLRYVVKNLQISTALRFGVSYLAEDAYHMLRAALRRDWSSLGAYLKAWLWFLRTLPNALQQRGKVQRLRVAGMSDRVLFAPARSVPPPRLDGEMPRLTLQDIREYYLPMMCGRKRKVLIVSPDVVGTSMAGPGIRCWELARVLGREFDVTLAVSGSCDLEGDGFEIVVYRSGERDLASRAVQSDVLVVSGYLIHQNPFLKQIGKPLVVDLYDPFIVENLHFHADKPMADRVTIHRNDLAVLNEQLQVGDFFLCASEKQRDYCLGLLVANNRVNPETWEDDRSLRRLIDVVPFGLPSRAPRSDRGGVKGIDSGIAADDKLILWGGGIWEWLDPLTVIRAMPRVVEKCPRAKLLFLGTRHPNTAVPHSRMVERSVALSDELGLTGRHVFFRDWTPYNDREGCLLEADVGISLHFEHLETRLSFRTRLLDYIWAGVPIVTSGGDELGELVLEEGLGFVVGEADVDGVAAALIELLSDRAPKERLARAFARVRKRFTWERAAAPLVAFCRDPYLAADKRDSPDRVPVVPTPTPVWQLPIKAWRVLGRGGPGALRREVESYVRWVLEKL